MGEQRNEVSRSEHRTQKNPRFYRERTFVPMAKKIAKRPLVLLHILNFAGLFTLGILLLGVVIRPYQLVLLLPVLLLGILYWRFRGNLDVVAWYFALSLSVGFWIVICENIVTIDNALGTRISARLELGMKLHSYVDANIKDRRFFREECCNDPLSFHYKPGSRARFTYDCDTCNKPYEVVVDETGYLNQPLGLMKSSSQVDLFLAGDSVTQGYGVPSVIEFLREKIHIKMWNLSIIGYGPRQKINALITYALPKHPKWLIVEFYSGNDIPDVMDDEVCDKVNAFRCNRFEQRRAFLAHPQYGSMLHVESDWFETFRFETFDSYAGNYFTLAVSRYLMDRIKGAFKDVLVGKKKYESSLTRDSKELHNFTEITYPANPNLPIRPERFANWTIAGMAATQRHYQRLVTKLTETEIKPAVILLYDPSSYEIYRDILLDRIPKYDQASEIQLEALRSFAEKNGWIFLDLTTSLRSKLKENKISLYGRYDGTHWSLKGTAFVADVLAVELLKVIGQNKLSESTRSH